MELQPDSTSIDHAMKCGINTLLLPVALVFVTAVRADVGRIATLEDAIARTVAQNPLIQEQSVQIKAAEARILQSRLFPNPTAGVELENFDGDLSGTRQSETTVTLSQLFLLGGKREFRIGESSAQSQVVAIRARQVTNDILSQLAIAYAAVQRDQVLLEIAKQDWSTAKEVLASAIKRLELGGVLEGEVTRARVTMQTKELALEIAKANFVVSKSRLVAYWAGNVGDLSEVIDKDTNFTNESFNTIALEEFPAVALQKEQLNAAMAKLNSARANRMPDLTAQAGVRRLEDTSVTTFVTSLSIPLPVFDRNQGRILEAGHLVAAARKRYLNAQVASKAQFDALLQTHRSFISQYRKLTKMLLPESTRALRQMKQAYSVGRVGYLDLADTQRSFFGVKGQLATTVFSIHEVEAKLGAVMGTLTTTAKGDSDND